MDVIILSTIALGIAIALGVIFYLTRNASKGRGEEVVVNRDTILPGARRRQPVFARNARRAAREDVVDEEDDEPDIQLPEGKVGAKKMAKLQAKAEKKAAREAEERDRQDRKKKQELEDEERKKREDKEKALEKRREDEERKIREEKERKEHEEYIKMKEAFSVESEGFEEAAVEGTNSLMDFVNYIKDNKVVVIEDIAAQFNLKTQQAIDRIHALQTDGILTGVVDDRGKFIYISRDELEAVAKFVKQRGRVSISELVDSSNMLVDLTPRFTA